MKLSKVPSSSLQSQDLSLLELISSKYGGVRTYADGAFSEVQHRGAVVWCAVKPEQFVTDISPGLRQRLGIKSVCAGCLTCSNDVRTLKKRNMASH